VALVNSLPRDAVLQYYSARRWRDCHLVGSGAIPDALRIRRVIDYEHEETNQEFDVAIDRLRFAEFVDEESFFAQFK